MPIVIGPADVFVVDGNSWTQSRNGATPLPQNVLHLLDAPVSLRFYDEAEGGIGMTRMLEPDHLRRVDAHCHEGSTTWLLYWEGPHDLLEGHAPEETAERLKEYGRGRRVAGCKVITLTLLPVGTWAAYEAMRQTVNQMLRMSPSSYADVLVDPGADPLVGDPAAPFQGIYYSPVDRVHLTDAGSLRVATLVVAQNRPP